MEDKLWDTLLKFHREVAMPSIVMEIGGPIREEIKALDRKMEGRFDGVYQRLDRMESEYHALTAAVKRLEERMTALEARMTSLEQKLTTMPLRSELEALKARLEGLEKRLTGIEHKDSTAELVDLHWRIRSLESKIAEHEK